MLNGIVNLDKLTKYYKKLGNGVEELYHTMIQHMISLITKKIFSIDDVIVLFSEVILSELSDIHPNLLSTVEDKGRINRKLKQLLKESVLIEMESVNKSAESANMAELKNDKSTLSVVSNIAPPPVPTAAPPVKNAEVSFNNNNISAIGNKPLNQKGKAFTPYNNKNVSVCSTCFLTHLRVFTYF